MPSNPQQTIENIHNILKTSPYLVRYKKDEFNGGGVLHYLINDVVLPQGLAYVLCRGKNVTIEGIDCSSLVPADLDIQDNKGQTALESAQEKLLFLQASDNPNIDEQVKLELICNFIKLSQEGEFQKIVDQVENYSTTYNTEKNKILTRDYKETNITPSNKTKNKSVTFKDDDNLENIQENTKPHYPSFDEEWKKQDIHCRRDVFIDAYRENNFTIMENSIEKYNIKFKASDTMSELAY